MNCHFLSAPEKKKLIEQVHEQFNIADLPGLLLETGKEKVRLFTGDLSKEDLLDLAKSINIEIIGLYILRREYDLRLSFDATQLFAQQIKEKSINLTEQQLADWIRGKDLEIKDPTKGTVILRKDEDFFGCGKSTGERIANHVPKERRIKNKI